MNPSGLPSRALIAAVCAGLVALTWLVFGQTLSHDFVGYDDSVYVAKNLQIQAGLTASGVAGAFTHPHAENWHPLTTLSHMLDWQLYGLTPRGHHLTNLILHTIAALLLFLVLTRMTGQIWRSAFVAAIFAIHPLRVESVAWIAERKDVLSAVFFMLTLGAYLRYVRQPSFLRYLLLAGLFALGLMSKPMLVTVPFVLLLLDFWPLQRSQRSEIGGRTSDLTGGKFQGRSWWELIIEKLPLIALALVSSLITFAIQVRSANAIPPLPFLWRFENAIVSYVTYIGQMFWPARLAVFYPHPEDSLPLWQIALAAALLVVITGLAWRWRKTRPSLLVGWGWYLLMLGPVIEIVGFGLQGHADRYTYLPHIGLSLAFTRLVADLAKPLRNHRAILAIAAWVVVVAFGAVAWKQTSYWRNGETLWTHTLAVTQNNDVAQANLGTVLVDQGKLDDAISHLQTALEIRSHTLHLHYDLSRALIHSQMGFALAGRGQVDDAIDHFRQAVKIQPNYPDAHYNLGTALFRRGQIKEAMGEWQHTLALRPDDPEAHSSLGNAFVQAGRLSDAISHYEASLRLAPDSVTTLNNLAWILATSPDASIRNGSRAVALAQRTAQLPGGQTAIFLRTLAAAYAEAGRFNDASETAQRALQSAERESNAAGVQAMRADLDLYRARTPLRDSSLTNASSSP